MGATHTAILNVEACITAKDVSILPEFSRGRWSNPPKNGRIFSLYFKNRRQEYPAPPTQCKTYLRMASNSASDLSLPQYWDDRPGPGGPPPLLLL